MKKSRRPRQPWAPCLQGIPENVTETSKFRTDNRRTWNPHSERARRFADGSGLLADNRPLHVWASSPVKPVRKTWNLPCQETGFTEGILGNSERPLHSWVQAHQGSTETIQVDDDDPYDDGNPPWETPSNVIHLYEGSCETPALLEPKCADNPPWEMPVHVIHKCGSKRPPPLELPLYGNSAQITSREPLSASKAPENSFEAGIISGRKRATWKVPDEAVGFPKSNLISSEISLPTWARCPQGISETKYVEGSTEMPVSLWAPLADIKSREMPVHLGHKCGLKSQKKAPPVLPERDKGGATYTRESLLVPRASKNVIEADPVKIRQKRATWKVPEETVEFSTGNIISGEMSLPGWARGSRGISETKYVDYPPSEAPRTDITPWEMPVNKVQKCGLKSHNLAPPELPKWPQSADIPLRKCVPTSRSPKNISTKNTVKAEKRRPTYNIPAKGKEFSKSSISFNRQPLPVRTPSEERTAGRIVHTCTGTAERRRGSWNPHGSVPRLPKSSLMADKRPIPTWAISDKGINKTILQTGTVKADRRQTTYNLPGGRSNFTEKGGSLYDRKPQHKMATIHKGIDTNIYGTGRVKPEKRRTTWNPETRCINSRVTSGTRPQNKRAYMEELRGNFLESKTIDQESWEPQIIFHYDNEQNCEEPVEEAFGYGTIPIEKPPDEYCSDIEERRRTRIIPPDQTYCREDQIMETYGNEYSGQCQHGVLGDDLNRTYTIEDIQPCLDDPNHIHENQGSQEYAEYCVPNEFDVAKWGNATNQDFNCR